MKTKNLLLGLGIAAGAFVTVAALRRNNAKVREYVAKGIKRVTPKKSVKKEKEDFYV